MQIQIERIAEILRLAEPCSSYEGVLQARWNRIPLNTPLHLADGTPFSVLSRGTWNVEAGPDFRNAKLRIGGRAVQGDVEVHRNSRDWFRHGHNRNPLYDRVALHVVERLEDENPELPVYLLPSEAKIDSYPPPLCTGKGECAGIFDRLSPSEIHEIFVCAGVERMHARAHLILHDIIRHGTEYAFLTRLFDAYGFKRNRPAFVELLNRVWTKYPREQLETHAGPLLWGESGLLPAESSGEVPAENLAEAKRIWECWWMLRPDSAPPIEWKRDGGRPLNSPERRVAGLCMCLKRHGLNPLPRWMELLRTAPDAKAFRGTLLSELIQNDPFWNRHTTFRAGELKLAASVTGEERARELAADVILPSLRAYALLERNEKLADRVDAAFRNLPRTQKNHVFTTAIDKWFRDSASAEKLFKDAASRQGVLHIYANFCAKTACDCKACLIRNGMISKA